MSTDVLHGARVCPRRQRDDGVATVWAAIAVAVLTSVLVAGLHLGAAIHARHRAESAADLAALAAARQAVRGEATACHAAATIASAAGGRVTRCLLVGWDALVEVRVPVAMALPGLDAALGQAMAGPEPAAQCPATAHDVPAQRPPSPATPRAVAAASEQREPCTEAAGGRR